MFHNDTKYYWYLMNVIHKHSHLSSDESFIQSHVISCNKDTHWQLSYCLFLHLIYFSSWHCNARPFWNYRLCTTKSRSNCIHRKNTKWISFVTSLYLQLSVPRSLIKKVACFLLPPLPSKQFHTITFHFFLSTQPNDYSLTYTHNTTHYLTYKSSKSTWTPLYTTYINNLKTASSETFANYYITEQTTFA